jgi:hypothetical protein
LLHMLAMFSFAVGVREEWIHLVEGGGWMLKFVQDDSANHIAQQCFIVLGIVQDPTIINKDFL